MSNKHLLIKKSPPLNGTVHLAGAKNAVLTIMASLILTNGRSILRNVPDSNDIRQMIQLLTNLGATVTFSPESNILEVNTSSITNFQVSPEIMNKMRASILVMGPLLARFGQAEVALPGGCLIGTRPIDFHLKGFTKLGAIIGQTGHSLHATLQKTSQENRVILEYPSVGATENIMMCAVLMLGTTTIVNAAFEPEVLDLVSVLKKMGAKITCGPGLTIQITGVHSLRPVVHDIIPDRLEAGSLLLAAAITGGQIHIPNAQPDTMDIFLEKLAQMGHEIDCSHGIYIKATTSPLAINVKTAPYPGFPTDLQAPMMAALTLANGVSEIEETVFENRLIHVQELKKMGAQIDVAGTSSRKAIVRGVKTLCGCEVVASDIRASCALALAGLAATGQTKMTGVHHWKRGYDQLEQKLGLLGGNISLIA
ncbi:UDP-N-acetylglucosamine 1-carboxyvinyltransferase [Candidatus Dependentiae bacterium]|nr:UDP-N-acetylglucosamine 1-carboxyvinyltransferase [Candidatus Dependentiae bacterium]